MQTRPDNRGGSLGGRSPLDVVKQAARAALDAGGGAYPTDARGRRPTPPPRRGPGTWPPAGLGGLERLPQTATQAANRIAGYTDPLEQQAMALVDPLIQSVTNRIGAETRAGAGAIGGYANRLAQSLMPFEQSAGNIYGQAQQSQAAADAALSSALRGEGDTLAKELGGKLAQIGAPAGSPEAAAAAATGSGAANALLGTGSASLSQLIGEGAHAREFAAKQPGIARSQGLADIRDLELAQQAKLYDQAQQLEGQIPGIVQQLRSSKQQADQYATSQAERVREFDITNREKVLLAKMATDRTQSQLDEDWRKFQSLQANENARTSATLTSREGIAAANRQGQDERAAASNSIKWYQAQTARWKAQHPTATAAQASTASRARWVKMAEDFYHGVPQRQHYDSTSQSWLPQPGTGQPPVRYGTALRILMSAGATRQTALQILNSLYQPGEGGRPAAPPPKPTPDRGFRDAQLR